MNVALITTFAASRKEPLAEVLQRIHSAFVASGLETPEIAFAFAEGPLPGSVSSVDRVLKRHPSLRRFESTHSTLPTLPPVRQISNRPGSPAAGEQVDFATVLAVAAGVPRSFPFHNVTLHFKAPAFGVSLPTIGPAGPIEPGVLVGDSWWVNGRNRSVTAVTSVEVDAESRALPSHPETVAAVLAACGKAKNTVQIPLAQHPGPATHFATPPPDVARAVGAILVDFRQRLPEVVARASMPHTLPSTRDAVLAMTSGVSSGPKKPSLVRAFKPLGYDCRGESGTFTLRRKTDGNLTVEIHLDVGTWSNSLTAFYSVKGLGFGVRLPLPPTAQATGGQYPIGDAARWQQIVENLAALVQELDRSFVPAIAAAAGPSPSWFAPETSS